MEQKLKKVFENFPGVDTLYHDNDQVYFNNKTGACIEISRKDFFAKPKKTKPNE